MPGAQTARAVTHAWEIGTRASNYDEQVAIAEAADEVEILPEDLDALTAFDRWRIERLAGRLAALRRTRREAPATSPTGVAEVLRVNRLLQRHPARVTSRQRAVLEHLHREWLPTYAAALEEFDPAGETAPTRAAPVTVQECLARVCAPFSAAIRRDLEPAVEAVNRASGRELFGPTFVDAHAGRIVARLELALAWAVEADQNVALARDGLTRETAGDDYYAGYFERTFHDAVSYHAFYLRFPVLGRWLAAVTRLVSAGATELLGRLHRDVDDVGETMFGQSIERFTGFDLGKSDAHAGGRTVTIVHVALASGAAAFVYKPRCLRAELAMQELLETLRREGVLEFGPRRVLVKDGYGYEQRIPSDHNRVGSREEAERVYEELGGYLAIFHALGGSDLHYENVLVADGHAFVCDCETALSVVPRGQERPWGTVVDSVYRTGLLDWPVSRTADVVQRQGGLTGGESYEVPFAVPRLQDGPYIAIRHETGLRVEDAAGNRLHLDGRMIEPNDFEDAIVRGFTRVYRWFARDPASASRCIRTLFADSSVRFVPRATQSYNHLLAAAQHPRCLVDPLEADLVFGRLSETSPSWDESRGVEAAEARSLWQLDVPLFAVPASGATLPYDGTSTAPVDLPLAPLDRAVHRIHALSDDDRVRQVRYISTSLGTRDAREDGFTATATDYARLVGDELRRVIGSRDASVGYTNGSRAVETPDIRSSLYYGDAGFALFLAYLDSVAPDERVRDAAERAAAAALTQGPSEIGAFQGLAGLVYLATHLYHLWGGKEWRDVAISLSRRVDAGIEQDRAFDVLLGAAGVIPVMLGLAQVTGEGVDIAHRCARHLLRHAERGNGGLSWPPEHREHATANLTGFSHGAAGIGWALILLGARSGREEYVDAGKRAFAYESSYYDEGRGDWYDLRTSVARVHGGGPHFGNAWCNGAPGIALSRLGSWAALGKQDDDLLGNAYRGVAATLRNFSKLGNDTLCHGTSGNAEVFVRFARLKDEPAYMVEATLHAQEAWRRFATGPEWPKVGGAEQRLPGLMAGIAGPGMHFLRLAYPDLVPSPLLLDPPPTPD